MIRIASVIGLPSENAAEYEALHAAVWPEVLHQLSRSNIVNFSIYRYGEQLFSYMEYVGDDYDADMLAMSEDPATQRWWGVCNPLQRPVSERAEGEWWHQLPEIFHLS